MFHNPQVLLPQDHQVARNPQACQITCQLQEHQVFHTIQARQFTLHR